jgi:adenine-specific DNA-methyltransferase
MKKLTTTDAETKSADTVAENVAKLKALFPEIITEGPKGAAINVDALKALVGDGTVTDIEEKYCLNWHGKRRARQLALTPSTGTLRPCPEESVDWETTQNLMIEGDNLEVLKLLQKSYAGKVKLIYIDPPYNTGKDFVYPDDYRDSIKNYLELTGQVDGNGRKMSSNTEASGRFHTDWLNIVIDGGPVGSHRQSLVPRPSESARQASTWPPGGSSLAASVSVGTTDRQGTQRDHRH